MSWHFEEREGILFVRAQGPRFPAPGHPARAELLEKLETSDWIAFDLACVKSLDSSDLGLLVEAFKSLQGRGKIRFFGAQPRPEELIRMTGLHRVLLMDRDGSSALANLEAARRAHVEGSGTEIEPADCLDRATLDHLRALFAETPETFAEIVRGYCLELPARVSDMRAALAEGSPEAVQRIAHTLKSASAYLGALRLADLCAQLQDPGTEGSFPSAASILEELAAEAELVHIALLAEQRRDLAA